MAQTSTTNTDQDNPYKVRLVDKQGNRVVFDVSPDLVETRNVNYNATDPIHMPGQIYTYKTTSSRSYNLNVKLISRTTEEADKNLGILWRLRGWTMPRFGVEANVLERLDQNDAESKSTWNQDYYDAVAEAEGVSTVDDILGSPPKILRLSAYSNNRSQTLYRQHINKVPTVIQQLNITYPSDVTYFPTTGGMRTVGGVGTSNPVPMPTIMSVDITLLETHSPKEYEKFSLKAFRSGTLPGF